MISKMRDVGKSLLVSGQRKQLVLNRGRHGYRGLDGRLLVVLSPVPSDLPIGTSNMYGNVSRFLSAQLLTLYLGIPKALFGVALSNFLRRQCRLHVVADDERILCLLKTTSHCLVIHLACSILPYPIQSSPLHTVMMKPARETNIARLHRGLSRVERSSASPSSSAISSSDKSKDNAPNVSRACFNERHPTKGTVPCDTHQLIATWAIEAWCLSAIVRMQVLRDCMSSYFNLNMRAGLFVLQVSSFKPSVSKPCPIGE